jgi:hypothetical protein
MKKMILAASITEENDRFTIKLDDLKILHSSGLTAEVEFVDRYKSYEFSKQQIDESSYPDDSALSIGNDVIFRLIAYAKRHEN